MILPTSWPGSPKKNMEKFKDKKVHNCATGIHVKETGPFPFNLSLLTKTVVYVPPPLCMYMYNLICVH